VWGCTGRTPGHARDFGIAVKAAGSKVADAADEAYLREQLGDALVAWVGVSRHVKAAEQGHPGAVAELEPANRAALDILKSTVDSTKRDWSTYTALAAEFHRRNAYAWANAKAGYDLTDQIDPDFVLGPAAVDAPIG
jgi:CO dehydrogenase maturation factor